MFCPNWTHWKKICYIFTPDTILKWHRQLVKSRWAWISQKSVKNKSTPKQEIKQLIIQMKKENMTWGAERIKGELLKIGIKISKRTIQKILRSVKDSLPSPAMSQNWKAFLKNNVKEIMCCDFLTVTTAFFKTYYVFFVLKHSSREIIHVNFTEHPTQAWVKQQLRESTPYVKDKVYLIHDRDSKFAFIDFSEFSIEPICISYCAPDMNAYAERFVGSIRRECFDHLLLFNEKQIQNILREYKKYYNTMRPHQGIAQKTPLEALEKETLTGEKIDKIPILGGLHHHYFKKAA